MKLFLCLAMVLFFVCPVFAQEVVSDWDDAAAGLAGWVQGTSNAAAEYHETGGNPGGFVKVSGNMKTGIKTTQPEFIGNYVQKNINNISIDIMVFMQQLDSFKPTIKIRFNYIYAAWNYELSDFVTTAGVWQHFEVYFDPTWSDAEAQANGWYMSPGAGRSFPETMEHVESISVISGYPPTTAKSLGYDNFRLSYVAEPPAPAEEVVEEPEETTEETTAQDSTTQATKTIEPMIKPIQAKPVLTAPVKIRKK